LIRVVRSPAGEVFLDERGKLPGRGAYICVRRECLGKAQKNRALARALKTEIPAGLYARLEEYIESYWKKLSPEQDSPPEETRLIELRSKELRSLLGLSRRAGLLHIGMDSVKSQCAKFNAKAENAKMKKPLLILAASDCSEAVRDFALRQAGDKDGKTLRLELPLSIEEISAAVGANNVQVIALPLRGGLADRIVEITRRAGACDLKLPEGGVALEQNESV
jgi:predicted RNA-binding protein YlxR (DUF448 family)